MRVIQKHKTKYYLLSFLATLGVFSGLLAFMPPTSGTAYALTEQQCINKYGSDVPGQSNYISNEEYEQLQKDGCEIPNGPCIVVFGVSTWSVQCAAKPDPEEQQWSKQKCISTYHGKTYPTTTMTDNMRRHGCSKEVGGPCVQRTINIPLVPIIDCKGEYTAEAQACILYKDHAAEFKACKKGKTGGEAACSSYTGAEKQACLDGAGVTDEEDPSNLEACDNSDGFEGDPALCHTACTSNDCNFVVKYVNPIINKFLAPLAVLAVVIGVIWGAITYSMSGGDPQKAAQGKSRIQKSLIGLVSFVFLYALLNWLIPGGV